MPKKEEKQITSEELDLDKVMEEGLEKFDEDLKKSISDISESTETPTDDAGPAKKKESETPKESSEEKTKAELAEEKKKAGEAAAVKEAKEKESTEELTDEEKAAREKKEARFETHEKAEEGYKNLQGEKTRVDQENKKLKAELAATKEAEKIKVEKVKTDQEIMDFAVERHEESLKEIDELDPDDADYQKNVATIWAKKDRGIRNFEIEHDVGLKTTVQKPEEDTDEDALEHVEEIAKKHGIDPKDKFFLINCAQAPTEDEKGEHIDFEKQIEWAVNETKNYIELHEKRIRESQKSEAEKKAKENQEQELPLGKSTTEVVTEKEEGDKPVSLDDALESAAEERRL